MRRSVSAATLLVGGLLALIATPALAADPTPAVSPSGSGAPGAVPLEGTTWQLTNLRLSGAYAPVPLGALTTLTLQDGTASGSGGCNRYSAPYTLDDDSLTFGQVTSTLILCEGAGGLVETFYFADLPAVATWAIEGDVLTLSADDAQPVVAYTVQATPSPEGSWIVTSYANGTGAIVSVPDDSVTVAFDATSVSGNAGCNGFGGSWTMTGSTLAIGPLMSTKMACSPAEIMDREAAVMADLEASTTVSAGPDGGIELHDATGALRLSLSTAPPVAAPSGSPAA